MLAVSHTNAVNFAIRGSLALRAVHLKYGEI